MTIRKDNTMATYRCWKCKKNHPRAAVFKTKHGSWQCKSCRNAYFIKNPRSSKPRYQSDQSPPEPSKPTSHFPGTCHSCQKFFHHRFEYFAEKHEAQLLCAPCLVDIADEDQHLPY